MLQLVNLRKAYGSRLILQIPQLTIPAGAYWIKGNNGSGKTSLMKIIAGINPFDGAVLLNGVDLVKNPVAYRQQVSYAEAEPVFPGFVCGWDLIRFVQNTRKEKDNDIQTLIDYYGIRNFLDYPVSTYSSGMTKKLSLLLAFIGQTKLILLDEPLITLEGGFLPKLFQLIKEHKECGTSFLLSSHQSFQPDQFQPDGVIVVENQMAQFIAS